MHLLIIGPLCRSQASVGSTHDCPKIETKIYTSFVFCSCVPFTCTWKCFLSTWGKCCKWCHIIFNLLKMQWPKMFSHFEPILSLKSQWCLQFYSLLNSFWLQAGKFYTIILFLSLFTTFFIYLVFCDTLRIWFLSKEFYCHSSLHMTMTLFNKVNIKSTNGTK